MRKPKRTVDQKHLYTVRAFDGDDNYVTHRMGLVGRPATRECKRDLRKKYPQIKYFRVWNETLGVAVER
jgi:hypothetical protein